MTQECPKCENEFKLLNVRSSFGGVETQGHATYCPYCGVNLNSWDAWLNKEILIFYDDDQLDGLPVILKDTNDYDFFEVLDQETGKLYLVNSKYAFTPN